ncbi:MAG: hypothetical protein GX909_00765 [Clostridiaceae bacterium]|nr:hypothetical protein [Clostridiaceae bacterium]
MKNQKNKNNVRKHQKQMVEETQNDQMQLQYGTQVALMSIGAILGIITIVFLAILIFFKDLIF